MLIQVRGEEEHLDDPFAWKGWTPSMNRNTQKGITRAYHVCGSDSIFLVTIFQLLPVTHLASSVDVIPLKNELPHQSRGAQPLETSTPAAMGLHRFRLFLEEHAALSTCGR